MGFVLDYQPFFKVSAVEEGSGSPLAGFSFAPTSRCARLLSDHQLIFRARETGFAVYFATNPRAADPLMGKITRFSQFGFAVRLKDSTFFTRYAPDPAAMPAAQGNFGIIDIFWETPQDTVPAGGLNYTMTFKTQ
jgi:hypothetical protein